MKKNHVKLTASDKEQLEALLSKGSLPAMTFKRASALLELNRNKSFIELAKTFGVTIQTVSRWAKSYEADGLACLYDKPRSGRPVSIDGEQRAKITALACSEAPEGHTRWTLRMLADKAVELEHCEHLSHAWVGKILKKTNLSRT